MSIEGKIREALREHGGFEFDTITNPTTVTCFCQQWKTKWEYGAGYVDAVTKVDAAFYSHQAAVVAGIVQEAQAEAWDEGYTTGNAHNGRRDANPYRRAG